jgi:hypothetical protein
MKKRETLCRLRAPARLARGLIPVKHWRRLGTPVAAVFQFRVQLRFLREPVVGFEPTTCCLRNSCSTAELHRPLEPTPGLEPGTSILPRLCSAY